MMTKIRAALQQRRTRREYREQTDWLNTVLEDLRATRDREERAVLLTAAADIIDHLAELHTTAWGRDEDDTGRPMAVSLRSSAALLRDVARTELGVVVLPAHHGHGELHARAATEARLWAELAHTVHPGRRASLLRLLQTLAADHLGATAADVLAVIADTESPEDGRQDGRASLLLLRVVIAAVFVVIAVLIAVPGPDPMTRLMLFPAFLAVIHLAAVGWYRFVLPRLDERGREAGR